jgi:hypothetical protein
MTNLNEQGQIELGTNAVQLLPYVPRQEKQYELLTDEELIQYKGDVLTVDTEAYPNYFLIAFKHLKSGKYYVFENTATNEDCNKLLWIMGHYTTIGFNSIRYDLPLIYLFYNTRNTQILKTASNQLIFDGIFPYALAKEYGFVIPKVSHIDLIEVCPLIGSLKLYGARLHSPRIQELPFAHNEDLSLEQIAIVREYCLNDLDVTELLFNNLQDQLLLRWQLSQEYRQDLMSKSDAQIAEAVICGELKKITGKWPKKSTSIDKLHTYKAPSFIQFQTEKLNKLLSIITNAKYEVLENGHVIIPKEVENVNISIGNSIYRIGNGGLHSSEKQTSQISNNDFQLFDRDVASYYPAIVLNCGLFPAHLGEAFLTVYRSIVERRLAAKKAKNTAVADSLKITINGTFGKFGSPYSVLYSPELLIQVTVTGQLSLLMLIEGLESANIQVVSANTDGIMIKCDKKSIPIMKAWIKWWEEQTGFVTEETEYEALYSRDVNAYFAVKKDGKSKGKNIYYDPWNGDSKDAIWRFHKNPNAQICTEAVQKMVIHAIPVEKTIRECRDITRFVCVKNVSGGAHKDRAYLGKVVRWYYSNNVYGTINYVKNNNKVPDSEKAKPLMDLPLEFPDDIAYEIYVKKANEMLEDMAFFTKQKQITFF